MNVHHTMVLLTGLAVCTLAPLASAQAPVRAPAPLAAPAASAPPVIDKTQPRALTPGERRDSATAPGDLRPEDPVVPQLRMPLGKAPPVSTQSKAQQQRHDKAAAMGGVDDSVARCKASATPAARDACLSGVRSGSKAP